MGFVCKLGLGTWVGWFLLHDFTKGPSDGGLSGKGVGFGLNELL